MSRLPVSTGALLLIVMLSLGMSAGPASADSLDPTDPSTTTEPAVPAPSETVTPVPTESPPEPPPPESPPAESVPPESSPEPTPTEPTEPTTEPVPAAPADPETPPAVTELPDLRLTVVFERDSYFADERIVARASVFNAGTTAATDVILESTGNLTSHFWSGITVRFPTIEPGETIEGVSSGHVTTDDGVVRLTATVGSAEPDADPTDNRVTVSVPFTVVRGSYAGVVYGDADGSGAMDPGEELVGMTVTVAGGWPYAGYSTETDAAGRFVFPNLPRGDYWAGVRLSPWVFPYLEFTVDGIEDLDVVIRGATLITGSLSMSAEFGQPTYARGDTAHLVVTLTNTGPAIPNLTAECVIFGPAYASIWQWGQDGGAVLPARTSRTFDIAVPLGDTVVGYISVQCRAHTWAAFHNAVRAAAETRVPGAVLAEVNGILLGPSSGCGCGGGRSKPLPGLTVYLRNPVTAHTVARAVTDASGRFTFYNVPADLYHFGIVGPWTGSRLIVRPDVLTFVYYVYTQPGPDQPDPDPVRPPVTTPPGQGGRVPDLADTGADVRWLALGGLLTLTLGVGITAGARRLT